MEFEWDEDKRLRNIAKHGIDFPRAQYLFDGRPTVTRTANGRSASFTVGMSSLSGPCEAR